MYTLKHTHSCLAIGNYTYAHITASYNQSIHVYRRTCLPVYAGMYPYIHARMHVCTHARMHVCRHAGLHVCTRNEVGQRGGGEKPSTATPNKHIINITHE